MRLRRTPPSPAAEQLTAAERKRLESRRRFMRKRRLHILGYGLMLLGAAFAGTHVLAHAEVFGGQPSGVTDLLVGYPMAAVLFLGGVIGWGQ